MSTYVRASHSTIETALVHVVELLDVLVSRIRQSPAAARPRVLVLDVVAS